mgnify:CR=1 FL=1
MSRVRLSAGRQEMSDETQAMAFMAGANSIFYGDQLLTTSNPQAEADRNRRKVPDFVDAAQGKGKVEAFYR